jgi:hypothetical protein
MVDYQQQKYVVEESVYSTGFRDSITNTWVPPGTIGVITKSETPVRAEFLINQDAPDEPWFECAVLRSDISRTEKGAYALAASPRSNRRWRF